MFDAFAIATTHRVGGIFNVSSSFSPLDAFKVLSQKLRVFEYRKRDDDDQVFGQPQQGRESEQSPMSWKLGFK